MSRINRYKFIKRMYPINVIIKTDKNVKVKS